ncbi:hypothetical protein NOVO_04025 [Rickettsiales bacterium Ac37b]|nr:hypothetical protein NOVO_04025 [Rickettsiales bacterium Ac37b]
MYRYFILFLFISACGFQPIYSQNFNFSTADELASISIEPIEGELGNKLHLKLKEAFNPLKKSMPIQYKLHIKLIPILTPAVIIPNSQILNYTSIIKVEYKLIDNQNNKEISEGTITSSDSYYASSSEFATFTSNQTSIENTFKQISDNMKNKLTAFLTNTKLNSH